MLTLAQRAWHSRIATTAALTVYLIWVALGTAQAWQRFGDIEATVHAKVTYESTPDASVCIYGNVKVHGHNTAPTYRWFVGAARIEIVGTETESRGLDLVLRFDNVRVTDSVLLTSDAGHQIRLDQLHAFEHEVFHPPIAGNLTWTVTPSNPHIRFRVSKLEVVGQQTHEARHERRNIPVKVSDHIRSLGSGWWIEGPEIEGGITREAVVSREKAHLVLELTEAGKYRLNVPFQQRFPGYGPPSLEIDGKPVSCRVEIAKEWDHLSYEGPLVPNAVVTIVLNQRIRNRRSMDMAGDPFFEAYAIHLGQLTLDKID